VVLEEHNSLHGVAGGGVGVLGERGGLPMVPHEHEGLPFMDVGHVQEDWFLTDWAKKSQRIAMLI
jgi:hypothetical protein